MITPERLEHLRAAYVAADQAATDEPSIDNLDARARALAAYERAAAAIPATPAPTAGAILGDLATQARHMVAKSAAVIGALACAPAREPHPSADEVAALLEAPEIEPPTCTEEPLLNRLTRAREGIRLCREAGAEMSCPMRAADWCPRVVAEDVRDTVRANLTPALCRLGEEERQPIRAHFGLGLERVPLVRHDSLRVIARILQEQPGVIAPSPQHDPEGRPLVRLARSVEVIPEYVKHVLLIGPAGTGKTIAGAFAIAVRGGMALQSDEIDALFTRDGAELRARVCRAPVLLVDQFGLYGKPNNVAALIKERDRHRGLTIYAGNLEDTAEEMARLAAAVGPFAWDRLQSGLFVPLVGASLRRPAAQRVAS